MIALFALLVVSMPPQEAQRPRPIDPAGWVGPEQYPREAMQLRLTGTVSFRLAIGADGKVTECTVTESSGHSLLDMQTCLVMRDKARFHPALDEKGQPVPGSWSSRYRWSLGD